VGTATPNITGFASSSPALTIRGTSSNGRGVIELASNGATADGNSLGDLYFYDNTSLNARISAARATSGTTGYLAFFTNGGSGVTERARIDSSGNLLVGTTSAATPTTVAGARILASGKAQLTAVNSTSLDCILLGSTGAMVAFNYGATNVGTITTSGTSVAYNTSSDYRLKENVAPMQNALTTVAALKPVTYTWKADGSAGQGFIAHELQAVCPDAVTGEKDAVEIVDELDDEGNKIGTKEVPRYQGVDTSFLVATLVAAIQEQQTIIADLTTRLEALEAI